MAKCLTDAVKQAGGIDCGLRCPRFPRHLPRSVLLSGFEVNGRQHAVVRVLALRVLEHLDALEYVLPCALWRPAFVEEVITRRRLCSSEFFNDFLKRDGMDHGINLFPQGSGRHPADLRVWRRASSPPFGAREIGLLVVINPYLERAERELELDPMAVLTSRERDVALLVARGCPDKDISRVLDIGFATVRSHLQKCFDKLHCANRAELAALVVRRNLAA
jgi:DNA-binding CsgD family transcriptional regulator